MRSATLSQPPTQIPAALQDRTPSHSAGIDSRALLGPANEVVILHRGEPYRLRQTRQNKLILTK